jgi:hypothetical protein
MNCSRCAFSLYDPVVDHGMDTVARGGGCVVAAKMTRYSSVRVMDGTVWDKRNCRSEKSSHLKVSCMMSGAIENGEDIKRMLERRW